jgi:hypothetical protein
LLNRISSYEISEWYEELKIRNEKEKEQNKKRK